MSGHLSENQLAERWSISARTLQRWRPQGLGPAYLKLGGRVVYPIADVEEYERRQRRGGAECGRKKPGEGGR